jgi:hypothetical protein
MTDGRRLNGPMSDLAMMDLAMMDLAMTDLRRRNWRNSIRASPA